MKQFIIIIIFLASGLTLLAQPPRGGHDGPPPPMSEKAKEKIEALRKAYISDKLELTDTESEKFWPIYEAFKKEEKEFLKANKPKRKKVSEMTEAEAEALIDKRMEIEQKMLDIRKKYLKQMKGAIPALKIIKLERAEKGFRTEVMKRMKNRRDKMRERGQGERGDAPRDRK